MQRQGSQEAPKIHEKYRDSDYYTLSSDFQGTVRLALQHYIWREALGYNVHPSIPKLPQDAKIADIASGTGLWLVEVGRELGPQATLDAFDITRKQAPPMEWLPENMKFHIWDIFAEPPPQICGAYDFVHVRLVSAVMKHNNPEKVVRNLSKLLKPGGWLQWDDVDIKGSFVAKATPDLHAPAMDAWCSWMSSTKPGIKSIRDLWHGDNLQKLLQSWGFDTVEKHEPIDQFLQRMELMRYNSGQLLMLSEQLAHRADAPYSEEGKRMLRFVSAASKDAEKGSAMIVPPLIWTARKRV